MEHYSFLIDEEYDGIRLDKAITSLSELDLTRSYIQKLIKSDAVKVNDKKAKAGLSLKVGDRIEFDVPDAAPIDILPEDIPLDILYEDDSVIVINKPKGMVVHPANGHYTNTMVNALMYHCKDSLSGINGILRPGIVHRIDMDTTGSIIACKNDASHNNIADQLKSHSLNRTYRAICHGRISEDEMTIDINIGRSKNDRKKMAVVSPDEGKCAITHVKVLERFNDFTYIECRLETGRTHQIRVHMASVGHPLAGDNVYSTRKCPFKTEGQCLHAYKLGFIHPVSGEYVETVAPLPEYFEKILSVLRAK
ncbi:MAG: RluA family pseudouridine synthase [Lachnospiraceae bacterium]|nr:RluA family pseudouridine synthase [Lachnospiraceae bacterium]